MNTNKAIYFPGLNGIRAFAALMVVFAHVSNRMPFFNLKSVFREDIASHAVTIFFTLSGFLITFLLIAEKEQTGTIDIRKFYIRRILRIWPLYYVYLLLAIIASGFKVDWPIVFYLFIIANLRVSLQGILNIFPGSSHLLSMIGHYWSLGVEEQFYSFWPWVVRKSKKLWLILVILPVAFVFIKAGLRLANAPYGLITFFNYTRFGCMAFGGLGAYLYFYHQDRLGFFKNRLLELLTYLFFATVLIGRFHITSIIDHEIVAFFTLVIIYNQIANSKVLFSLENKVLDFLGKISFGIYVYHPLIIFLLSLVFADKLNEFPLMKTILIFVMVIIFTVLSAHLSYQYFEQRFLKIKIKYTTVKSAANKEQFIESN